LKLTTKNYWPGRLASIKNKRAGLQIGKRIKRRRPYHKALKFRAKKPIAQETPWMKLDLCYVQASQIRRAGIKIRQHIKKYTLRVQEKESQSTNLLAI